MTDYSPRIRTFHWRASVLASLLFSLFAVSARAETDSTRVARLFLWASDGNVRHRDLVEPAKDSLGQMGAKAAPWLAKKLGTSDARERLTLADIFEKIGKPATPFLIPYLDAPGEDTPRNTARCLERIKDTAAVIPLLAQMDHSEYSVRSQVATALGKTGDRRAVYPIIKVLESDIDSDVRKSCAVALGELGTSRATRTLYAALFDCFFGVRQAAVSSFGKIGAATQVGGTSSDVGYGVQDELYFLTMGLLSNAPSDFLIGADVALDTVAGDVLVALGAVGGKKASNRLLKRLESDDSRVRAFAVEGLALADALSFEGKIAKLKKRETDPFVLAQIARFEQIVIEKKNAEAKPK